jgi:hypothetical protein
MSTSFRFGCLEEWQHTPAVSASVTLRMYRCKASVPSAPSAYLLKVEDITGTPRHNAFVNAGRAKKAQQLKRSNVVAIYGLGSR